ncbi:hypothetical protein CR956_00455 [Candidatus Saccharibacteria bacterium]|nr:MAG: hypothetical protein CR956_00455 [Candidatus Saccharibacteria bacterium]
MPKITQKAWKLIAGDTAKADLKWLKVPKKRPLKPLTERDLLKMESAIGAELFGPLPSGRRRDFFCLDDKTWIWYEEWFDKRHRLQSTTVRYELQDRGVLKVQEGARYSYIEGEELNNLLMAIQMYYERVTREIYKRDPKTGEKLD